MYFRLVSAFVFPFLSLSNGATAQRLTPDIPYVENGHKRHVLDIYTRKTRLGRACPSCFGSTEVDGRQGTRAMSH
jgi:hypothetical protein